MIDCIFFYFFISKIFHFYKTQPYDTAKSSTMPGLPHFKIFNLGKLPYHILKFLARKLKIMDFLGGWVGVGGWVEAMIKICLLVGHSDCFYL